MKYSEFVTSLKKDPDALVAEYTPHKADLDHMVMGLSGESGELLDAIKKHTKYDKPLDMTNIIEELGDIEFYLEGLRQALKLDRDAIIAENYAKLSLRYSKGKFSNEQAQERADKA